MPLLYSMCIESNGDVLPCQSYYHPLGNLLTDAWDTIWNHELSVQLRERRNLPDKCSGCSLVPECGGGCPLQFQVEKSAGFSFIHPTPAIGYRLQGREISKIMIDKFGFSMERI